MEEEDDKELYILLFLTYCKVMTVTRVVIVVVREIGKLLGEERGGGGGGVNDNGETQEHQEQQQKHNKYLSSIYSTVKQTGVLKKYKAPHSPTAIPVCYKTWKI